MERKPGKEGIVMNELNEVADLFKSSSFYMKYMDTYFADIILRKALNCDISIHRYYGISKMSYGEVHKLSTDILRDLIEKFAKEVNFENKELFWKMIIACYLDPDSNGVREINGIKCTADGLFSIRRIYRKYGINSKTVEEYEIYRKIPIFYFPQEKNGINMTRASVFGDKIDYTLYDLKRYLSAKTKEERNKCKLIKAYNLPKTKAWIEALGSFENLVEWYGIKGIFVDKNYNVFDLEKGQNKIISGYLEEYNWAWSDEYYNKLKTCVELFLEGRC